MNVQYKIFKCIDVKGWLYNGNTNGLSESIISITRANALVHCPYVKDDDVVVVAATDDDKIVGYTAIFPEQLARPDMWIATGTTLWVDPVYADEFVGYNLVQRLWQSYPQCSVIGSDVARPAALIDKLLGASIVKYERHAFVFDRKIRVQSLRNLGSLLIEPFRKYYQHKAISRAINAIPTTCSVIARDTIDAEAYEFISLHSKSDTFLRSREMLNWILRYPFVVENPLLSHYTRSKEFTDQVSSSSNHYLQIYDRDVLIGVVLLGIRNRDMHVKMVYTDDSCREIVYACIIKVMHGYQLERLYTIYPELNEYILSHKLALRDNKYNFLFTYPKGLKSIEPIVLQGIDGDMFV